MFKMAVDPPQGDHWTISGFAWRENAPLRAPFSVTEYSLWPGTPVKSTVVEHCPVTPEGMRA
jgi:hypothetical protein